MGQYYKFLVIESSDKKIVGESWAHGRGAKLMEHSYFGNDFVNHCLTLIHNNPCKVAWVGDYSENGEGVRTDIADGFNYYYDLCWGETSIKECDPIEDDINVDTENGGIINLYLVNHTKKWQSILRNMRKTARLPTFITH